MKEILDFISQNEDMTVEVTDGVTYNMRDVNNESFRLYNAQFATGDTEENGFQRMFMRKMWVVYRTLLQGSDVDLRNLTIRSLNGVKVLLTGILKMAFYSHLKRTYFGEFIDKVMGEMCWFGTSVIKRVDGEARTVDLRNYITEANVVNPQERRHAELVYYTWDQMLSYKSRWKDNWDDIETLREHIESEGNHKFKVLEFWTWGKIDEDDEDIHKICIKYLDNTIVDPENFDDVEDFQPYVELERFKTPYKKRRSSKRMRKKLGEFEEMFPYSQIDLFQVPGRWQSMGCGELLANPQAIYNELYNNKRKLDIKGLMGINVHTARQGENGLSELSQDAIANLDTGTVITLAPGEEFKQMQVDMKTGDFSAMEDKIYELMRQIIGVTSQGTGEEMPASTSATQAAINQQVAQTVFDFTRERMHHGLKRLFNDGYAEDIVNELDEKELVAIVGDPAQLEELDNALIDNAMNKWALEFKNETGIYPSQQEYEANRDILKQELMDKKDTRFPEIKKDIIENMEYYIDFDIKDEAFDYKSRIQTLMQIKNDPTSTKSKAKVEDELLATLGFNPRAYDLTKEEVQQRQMAEQMQMMAQQGMLAAPQGNQEPQPA